MMSAPAARTSAGFIAFTVAAVPTGMNAGVRISPRRIAIEPVRAAPSVAEIEKEKRVTCCAGPDQTVSFFTRSAKLFLSLRSLGGITDRQ